MALSVTPGTGADLDTTIVSGAHRQNIYQRAAFESGTISNADVDSIETLAEIDTSGARRLYVSFSTTVALTAFTVEFRAAGAGSYFVIASAAGDYTSPQGPILGTSGDLTTAGTSGTHWLVLDVEGVQSVRLQAASTSASVSGHYGMN